MLHFIFSLDYEIYGNGEGSLSDLVVDPTNELMQIFEKHNQKFVVFAECAEFLKIKEFQSDPGIELIESQLKFLHQNHYEIGLHLHPQWVGAQFRNGSWELDFSKINICKIPHAERDALIEDSIAFLRNSVQDKMFCPATFRSGLWLMQPTLPIVESLEKFNIPLDSSMFKGGFNRINGLNYRAALREKKKFWRIENDITVSDPGGRILEIPIYSEMVWSYKMLSSDRKKSTEYRPSFYKHKTLNQKVREKLDYLRLTYPMKLDFTKMGYDELVWMTNRIIKRHKENHSIPIVLIGHSKNKFDFSTVDRFLTYLSGFESIKVTTFREFKKIIN